MIELSILLIGVLLGLMLAPMLDAIQDGTFFDWGDEDEETRTHERR
ncbi:hypothetical protein [Ligilactobacillus salivarius]|nr:hypothetical protein [Ligilactobacillus salivarius]